MPIPGEIVHSVKHGACILFLGSMVSAPSPEHSPFPYGEAPPSGAELSKRLAAQCSYPGQDDSNLQRVSLFYQYRQGGSRQSLVRTIREEITKFKQVTADGRTIESVVRPSPILH